MKIIKEPILKPVRFYQLWDWPLIAFCGTYSFIFGYIAVQFMRWWLR